MIIDNAHIALNLVSRKRVAGISIRTEGFTAPSSFEARLMSSIRVVKPKTEQQ